MTSIQQHKIFCRVKEQVNACFNTTINNYGSSAQLSAHLNTRVFSTGDYKRLTRVNVAYLDGYIEARRSDIIRYLVHGIYRLNGQVITGEQVKALGAAQPDIYKTLSEQYDRSLPVYRWTEGESENRFYC